MRTSYLSKSPLSCPHLFCKNCFSSYLSLPKHFWWWFNYHIFKKTSQVVPFRKKAPDWYHQGWGPLLYERSVWEQTSASSFKNMFLKEWFLQLVHMVLFNKHFHIMKVWKSLIPKSLQRGNHLNTQVTWINEKYNQIERTRRTEGMENTIQLGVGLLKGQENNIFQTMNVSHFKTKAELFVSYFPQFPQEQGHL